MKKHIIYGFILSVLLFFVVVLYFKYNLTSQDKDVVSGVMESSDNNGIKQNKDSIVLSSNIEVGFEDILSGVELSASKEDLQKEKVASYITDKIINNSGIEGKFYKGLEDNFEKNIIEKTSIEKILEINKDNKGEKKLILDLQVFDVDSKEGVKNVDIYFWGYYVGYTDKDGYLKKTITIPIYISDHHIMSFKKGYTDGFVQFSLENTDTSKFVFDIGVQKTDQYQNLENNNIKITKDKSYKFNLEGDCSFETLVGECYTGKVNIDVGYISPNQTEQRELLSIPMASVSEEGDNISGLDSSGMAFINVFDEEGNLLKKNPNKKIEMCYYMPQFLWDKEKEDIKNIIDNGETPSYDDYRNYRWFDKSKSLWIPDKTATKEKGDSWICFQTKFIY